MTTQHAQNNKQRLNRFLTHLVKKPDTPVQLNITAPNEGKSVASKRFISALAVALPALVGTNAAHAGTPKAPQIIANVNQAASITLKSLRYSAIDLVKALHARHRYGDDLKQVRNQIEHCYLQSVENSPILASQLEPIKAIAARWLAYDVSATEGLAMMRWAKLTGQPENLAVAAYCENPGNWRKQVNEWLTKANALNYQINQQALLAYQANTAIERHAERTQTQVDGFKMAAYYQAQNQGLDKALVQQVRGDWLSAAFSVASGVAQALDARETRQDIDHTRRNAQRGSRVARDIDNLSNQRDRASRVNRIGRIIGDAGRVFDVGPRIGDRVRSRARY